MSKVYIRHSQKVEVTIASGAAESGEIDLRDFAMAIVHMPAAWTSASIGFKVCHESGGSFLPLYDKSGSLVQVSSPIVDSANEVPAEIAAARYVKLWSQDGSGNDTNQAAARTIVVDLKA